MVDTVRPLATVLNLLADNVAGDISAQDVRDAVLSLWVQTIPIWSDIAHNKGQFVLREGRVYEANDPIPAGTGFVTGTTGATWALVLDGSGLFPTVANGRLLTVDGTGAPIQSSLTELTDRVTSDKQIQAPGGGGITLSNWEATAQGAIIGFQELASQTMYLPVASRLETAGASRPFFELLGTAGNTTALANTSEEFATSADTHQFQYVTSERALVTSYTVERPAGAANAIECNLTIRLNSHTDPNPLIDYQRDHPQSETFTLAAGSNTITLPAPAFFPADTTLYVTIESLFNDNLRLLGQTIDVDPGPGTNNQPVPSFTTNRRVSVSTPLAYDSETRTLEEFQDTVATMFTGGTHNGITVTYDDTDGFIDLAVTGTTPPLSTEGSVSAFSIDIPATVNVGTDLNTARTVQFTTANTSDIATLELVVTVGTNQTITVPASDGAHSQSVTLAGISTAAAGTVTFQIRGTRTGGQAIMSNVQTVTIRAVTADEQAYYGVRATNDFVSVDLSLLTSVDVQPPGSQYTISGSWPATEFVGILEPQDRPITSIIETAFGTETLTTWTRTASARTINGQLYDLLTQQNNGPTGNYEFRVTHG